MKYILHLAILGVGFLIGLFVMGQLDANLAKKDKQISQSDPSNGTIWSSGSKLEIRKDSVQVICIQRRDSSWVVMRMVNFKFMDFYETKTLPCYYRYWLLYRQYQNLSKDTCSFNGNYYDYYITDIERDNYTKKTNSIIVY